MTMQENDQPHQVPSGGAESTHQEERGPQRGFGPGRRSFDRLILPFSACCMNAPLEQLDKEIEKGLKEVNSFFNGDRIEKYSPEIHHLIPGSFRIEYHSHRILHPCICNEDPEC